MPFRVPTLPIAGVAFVGGVACAGLMLAPAPKSAGVAVSHTDARIKVAEASPIQAAANDRCAWPYTDPACRTPDGAASDRHVRVVATPLPAAPPPDFVWEEPIGRLSRHALLKPEAVRPAEPVAAPAVTPPTAAVSLSTLAVTVSQLPPARPDFTPAGVPAVVAVGAPTAPPQTALPGPASRPLLPDAVVAALVPATLTPTPFDPAVSVPVARPAGSEAAQSGAPFATVAPGGAAPATQYPIQIAVAVPAVPPAASVTGLQPNSAGSAAPLQPMRPVIAASPAVSGEPVQVATATEVQPPRPTASPEPVRVAAAPEVPAPRLSASALPTPSPRGNTADPVAETQEPRGSRVAAAPAMMERPAPAPSVRSSASSRTDRPRKVDLADRPQWRADAQPASARPSPRAAAADRGGLQLMRLRVSEYPDGRRVAINMQTRETYTVGPAPRRARPSGGNAILGWLGQPAEY